MITPVIENFSRTHQKRRDSEPSVQVVSPLIRGFRRRVFAAEDGHGPGAAKQIVDFHGVAVNEYGAIHAKAEFRVILP